MKNSTILEFDAEADEIWQAYAVTKKGFPPWQREYAVTLPAPSCVLLATSSAGEVIANLIPEAPLSQKTNLVKELLTCSKAILLLDSIVEKAAASERKILYMHTRTHWLGAGLASALLERAQQRAADVILFADAAACRTWDSSLVLLRNWFACTIDLWSCDLPRPRETPSPNSHRLMFIWKQDKSKQDHIDFVRTAMQKQLARRSARAKEYAKELQAVVDSLECKLHGTAASAHARGINAEVAHGEPVRAGFVARYNLVRASHARKADWLHRRLSRDGACIMPGPILTRAAEAEVQRLTSLADDKTWWPIYNSSDEQHEQSERRGRRLLEDEQKVKVALRDELIRLGLQCGRHDVMAERTANGTDGITAIRSLPGCKQQAEHCDRAMEGSFAQMRLADVPLSVLWALEDGTRLVVEGYEVELRKGEMIIFRGDKCHAGAAYNSMNTRVHAYLDPIGWPIDKDIHACHGV